MAIELFSNPPTPGGSAPWVVANLSQAITTAPAPGTVENWGVSTSAPATLRSSQTAQFRVVIDSEILIVTASASGASPWTFTRGAEGTTPVPHASGASIYHVLTAGALNNISSSGAPTGVLLSTNNLSDLGNAGTARTNLGLGSLATQSALTTPEITVAWPTIVETPESHGAVGDGTTDDTAAIKAAISAAVTRGIANGSYYGEVWFSGGTYAVKGALDTSQSGSSQIPIPILPTNGPKFTLVLRAKGSGAGVGWHWHQTVSQPCTLFSSGITGTGEDSIIGGPKNAWVDPNGAPSFSNMQLVLDGMTVGATHDCGLIYVDARHLAQFNAINGLGVTTERTAVAHTPVLANSNTVGVYFPRQDNNDNNGVDNLVCYDLYYGFAFADHFRAERIQTIYCNTGGLMSDTDGGLVHGAHIDYWSCEGGGTVLQALGSSTQQFPIRIGQINVEGQTGTYDIDDSFNCLYGDVGWSEDTGREPSLHGCRNLVVETINKPPQVRASERYPYAVVETPEKHGAVRDGVTDDTAAIQAAINAAVTRGQANGSNYAEVWFSAGIYQVAGAPGGHGTPTFANSQITLPLIASGTSTPKFTLKLKGLEDGGTSLVHWNQTVGQKSGAVIRTSATGTNDVTFGEASVIGGPTNVQGYGGASGNAWSNMMVIVDGLRIVSPTANPTMCGFNFEGLLEAKIISAGYFADASPATMAGFITTPATFTNQWVYGLKMPMTDNNDLCIVDDWSAEGVWYSIVIAEHTHVRDMRSVYCGWGIMLDNRVSTPHWSQIDYASVEICVNCMGLLGVSGEFKVNIGLIDGESCGVIWDGNSLIVGDIGVGANASPSKFNWTAGGLGSWIGNWNSVPTNGQFMNITSPDTLVGATLNTPTVPASGTAFWNKSLRTGAVNIGGTGLTAVTVDGQAQQVVPGTYIVPPGKSITLTYTGTVTWNWMLL